MKKTILLIFVAPIIFLGCGMSSDHDQQKELERVISKYDLNDFTSAVMVMPIPGDIDKIDEKQNALLEDIKKITKHQSFMYTNISFTRRLDTCPTRIHRRNPEWWGHLRRKP